MGESDTLDTLILDFGFYPETSRLRAPVEALANQPDCEILKLDVSTARDEDWDLVLDKLLCARRCITL